MARRWQMERRTVKKLQMEYDPKELEMFIRSELSQHGKWLVERFQEALKKNGNVDTGTLLGSLHFTTARTSSDGSTSIGIGFETYGRAMEIAGRKRKKQARTNRATAWGKRNKRAKKVSWYNKNKYKGYGMLAARLSAGIGEDELKRIKSILAEAAQSN